MARKRQTFFYFSPNFHWICHEADSVNYLQCLWIVCFLLSLTIFVFLSKVLLFPITHVASQIGLLQKKLQKNIVLRFCTFCSDLVKNCPTAKQFFFCGLSNLFPQTIQLIYFFLFCISDSICIGQEIQCILYAGFVNRPCVARAVLQTPSPFIHWPINWPFSSKSSKYHYSQTVRTGKLKFWENVNPPPCV